MVFVQQDQFEWHRAEIGSDGTFSTSLPTGFEYELVYFDQEQGDLINADFDGVPAVFDLDRVAVDGTTSNLGSYTVSESHVINIRVENPDGNPLQNVPLSFYTQSGSGTGPRSYTTNRNGYVTHVDSDRPGIELASSITVRTHPPGGDGGETLGTVFANEDKEITVVLQNQDDYRNIIERESDAGSETPDIVESADDPTVTNRPTTTDQPTATDRPRTATQSAPAQSGRSDGGQAERGFLSNSADEPAFLSDPMGLTVGGFLLSVGGIVYQMIGGK